MLKFKELGAQNEQGVVILRRKTFNGNVRGFSVLELWNLRNANCQWSSTSMDGITPRLHYTTFMIKRYGNVSYKNGIM